MERDSATIGICDMQPCQVVPCPPVPSALPISPSPLACSMGDGALRRVSRRRLARPQHPRLSPHPNGHPDPRGRELCFCCLLPASRLQHLETRAKSLLLNIRSEIEFAVHLHFQSSIACSNSSATRGECQMYIECVKLVRERS